MLNLGNSIFPIQKGQDLKTPLTIISLVLEARTEGMSLNSVCRLFKVSKKSEIGWEKRFSATLKILNIYALIHSFMQTIIHLPLTAPLFRSPSLLRISIFFLNCLSQSTVFPIRKTMFFCPRN